ncbi:ABC transporter ATP-binding protein [Mesorhizobium sp. 1B3]|uniref:ABC transporter ATP-binding protein n=1 Tax=Mesorhizobium sp. 1B3 TaxID=3243599 RepID=UPI003D975737
MQPCSASHAPNVSPQTGLSVPLVRVEDLCVHFPISRNITLKAVDGVSFDVHSNEVFGLIGESGSGKSTVGRTIVALQAATEGRVVLEGEDISSLSGAALRRKRRDYQIVFQDPAGALNPRMTILQSLREPLRIQGKLSRAEQDEVALECLGLVGLRPEHAKRYAHELSGGQKQRVNIARVLTMKPKLLVCDEAVAALDVSIQAEIVNLFDKLQKELGLAYLFISHDLSVVSHVSHRIAVMYLGRLVEVGTVDQIMSEPLHPYTRALLRSRPVPVPASMRTRTRPALTGEIPSALTPPSGCRFRTRCQFAQARCAEEAPALREMRAGQQVACHFAGETTGGVQ